MDENLIRKIQKASKVIQFSGYCTVFTGAGVSVESGIPPFRGKNGLWSQYNPDCLDIDLFYTKPNEAWVVIKEIFYDFFGKASPNTAHKVISRLEKDGFVKAVITQNIDNLHQEAGSQNIFEFHGTAHNMVCIKCLNIFPSSQISLAVLPPKCPNCNGLLKPNFIFFGEGIPKVAYKNSEIAAKKSDVMIVVGTTGEVMPACNMPYLAKQHGATIIEINPEPSSFTNQITDIFLQANAGEVFGEIEKYIFPEI